MPAGLLSLLRGYLARLLDIPYIFQIRREFGGNSITTDALAVLKTVLSVNKTILFFPNRPTRFSVSYKLCALLGYSISTNPKKHFDIAIKRRNATYFERALLQNIPIQPDRIINANSTDISKQTVSQVFADVFGYNLLVDPTQYHGQVVEKSNANGKHDGRILQAPIHPASLRPECVYQKLIDNSSSATSLVLDYRLPVHGDQIPLVYLKYRPIANRFANRNSHVELAEPDQLFSQVELDQLLLMAKKMGIAFGEFDVLRDQDQRLYVVDVNNTPAGPPNGLPDAQARQALALMQKSFDALLLSFEATPATDS